MKLTNFTILKPSDCSNGWNMVNQLNGNCVELNNCDGAFCFVSKYTTDCEWPVVEIVTLSQSSGHEEYRDNGFEIIDMKLEFVIGFRRSRCEPPINNLFFVCGPSMDEPDSNHVECSNSFTSNLQEFKLCYSRCMVDVSLDSITIHEHLINICKTGEIMEANLAEISPHFLEIYTSPSMLILNTMAEIVRKIVNKAISGSNDWVANAFLGLVMEYNLNITGFDNIRVEIMSCLLFGQPVNAGLAPFYSCPVPLHSAAACSSSSSSTSSALSQGLKSVACMTLPEPSLSQVWWNLLGTAGMPNHSPLSNCLHVHNINLFTRLNGWEFACNLLYGDNSIELLAVCEWLQVLVAVVGLRGIAQSCAERWSDRVVQCVVGRMLALEQRDHAPLCDERIVNSLFRSINTLVSICTAPLDASKRRAVMMCQFSLALVACKVLSVRIRGLVLLNEIIAEVQHHSELSQAGNSASGGRVLLSFLLATVGADGGSVNDASDEYMERWLTSNDDQACQAVQWFSSRALAAWLLDNDMARLCVLGPSSEVSSSSNSVVFHLQTLKRCVRVYEFLGDMAYLSEAQLQCLWLVVADGRGRSTLEALQALTIVLAIIPVLSQELLSGVSRSLSRQLMALPVDCLCDVHLKTVEAIFVRDIYLIKTNRSGGMELEREWLNCVWSWLEQGCSVEVVGQAGQMLARCVCLLGQLAVLPALALDPRPILIEFATKMVSSMCETAAAQRVSVLAFAAQAALNSCQELGLATLSSNCILSAINNNLDIVRTQQCLLITAIVSCPADLNSFWCCHHILNLFWNNCSTLILCSADVSEMWTSATIECKSCNQFVVEAIFAWILIVTNNRACRSATLCELCWDCVCGAVTTNAVVTERWTSVLSLQSVQSLGQLVDAAHACVGTLVMQSHGKLVVAIPNSLGWDVMLAVLAYNSSNVVQAFVECWLVEMFASLSPDLERQVVWRSVIDRIFQDIKNRAQLKTFLPGTGSDAVGRLVRMMLICLKRLAVAPNSAERGAPLRAGEIAWTCCLPAGAAPLTYVLVSNSATLGALRARLAADLRCRDQDLILLTAPSTCLDCTSDDQIIEEVVCGHKLEVLHRPRSMNGAVSTSSAVSVARTVHEDEEGEYLSCHHHIASSDEHMELLFELLTNPSLISDVKCNIWELLSYLPVPRQLRCAFNAFGQGNDSNSGIFGVHEGRWAYLRHRLHCLERLCDELPTPSAGCDLDCKLRLTLSTFLLKDSAELWCDNDMAVPCCRLLLLLITRCSKQLLQLPDCREENCRIAAFLLQLLTHISDEPNEILTSLVRPSLDLLGDIMDRSDVGVELDKVRHCVVSGCLATCDVIATEFCTGLAKLFILLSASERALAQECRLGCLCALLRDFTRQSSHSLPFLQMLTAMLTVCRIHCEDVGELVVAALDCVCTTIRAHLLAGSHDEYRLLCLVSLASALLNSWTKGAIAVSDSLLAFKYRTGSHILVEILNKGLFGESSESQTCLPVSVPGIVRSQLFVLAFDLCTGCRQNILYVQSILNMHFDDQQHFKPLSPLTIVQHGLEFDFLRAGKCPFRGLINPGCMCYMNATLQQLFRVTSFRHQLMGMSANLAKDSTECRVVAQLQLVFARLQGSVHRSSIDNSALCDVLATGSGEPVNIFAQRDAAEFLVSLLQDIEDCKGGTAVVHHSFGFELKHSLTCKDFPARTRIEKCCLISVQVTGHNSLVSSLRNFIACETVDYSWASGANNRQSLKTEKRVVFQTLPAHLVIHLKRFEFGMEMMQSAKVNSRFEFPMVLDLGAYVCDGAHAQQMFALSGVVVHKGSASSGHYYSLCRGAQMEGSGSASDCAWWRFNDEQVTAFDMSSLAEETFGGQCQATDAEGNVTGMTDITSSAFILVYDRAEAAPAEESHQYSANNNLLELVRHENNTDWWTQLYMSFDYIEFVLKIVASAEYMASILSADVELTTRLTIFLIRFVMSWLNQLILIDSNLYTPQFRKGLVLLSTLVRRRELCAELLLRELCICQPDNYLPTLLLGDVGNDVLSEVMDLLVHCLRCQIGQIKLFVGDDKGGGAVWSPQRVVDCAQAPSALRLLCRTVCDPLLILVRKKPEHTTSYFSLVAELALASRDCQHFLLELGLQQIIINLLLAVNESVEFQSTSYYRALTYLIPVSGLSTGHRQVLLNKAIWTRVCMSCYLSGSARVALRELVQRIVVVDDEISQMLLECAVEVVCVQDCGLLKAGWRVCLFVCQMRDGLELSRVEGLLGRLATAMASQSQYVLATELSCDMLLRICRVSFSAVCWVRTNWDKGHRLNWVWRWLGQRKNGLYQLGAVMHKPTCNFVTTTLSTQQLSKHSFVSNNSFGKSAETMMAAFRIVMGKDPDKIQQLSDSRLLCHDSDEEPDVLVNRRVSVKSRRTGRFSEGIVCGYDESSRRHSIQYDEGRRDHDLSQKLWRLV